MVIGATSQTGLTLNNPDAFWKFELTELNTPASFIGLAPVLLLVVRQQLNNFLSRRGEAVWRNNPSQGGNVAPAEVTTAKWQSENVGESEVGW